MRETSWRRGLLVLGLCLIAALVQTAPLVLHLTSAIPFGNYPVPTVARLNLWALWWNSDRLLHGYRGYWQAPIFFPEADTFAYTEPQWLTGLGASLFWRISGSPALAYNAVFLTAFTLNGCCGYVLLRRLRMRFWPAVCGGLTIELLPVVADQVGVLQSVVVFPVLMVLACLVRFGRTGQLGSAVGSAAWMVACYHTSANTALLFGPAALFGALVLAGRWALRPQTAVAAAMIALASALAIAPVALVQARVLEKVEPERPAWMIAATSARPEAYAKMPATNWLRRRPPDRKAYSLYPGTGVLVLAAVGAWHGLRRRRLRRWTVYVLVTLLAYVLLSFGPLVEDQWLGSVLGKPYELLKDWYPGFRFARNLWRLGGLAQILLATLAGFGFAACLRSRPGRRYPALLTGALALALAIELIAAPIPLLDLSEDPTQLEWIRWLRASSPETTIIHVPMADGTLPENLERTAQWMNYQMYHGRRMGNGYAAYIPGRTALLMQLMPQFPDPESLRALRYFGITHVLASPDWMTSERATKLEQRKNDVVPELATKEMTVYRIVGAVPGQIQRQ